MKHIKIVWADLGVTAEVSAFVPADGVGEWHVILHVTASGDSFCGQLARLREGEARLTTEGVCAGATPVVRRYFLSDSTNQVPLIEGETAGSVSCIQQPPLDGSKVALWMYLQRGTEVSLQDGVAITRHNGYSHLWAMGMTQGEGTSHAQTDHLLRRYAALLARHGATLADNCLRTWFYVRDVDTQYSGMVEARRALFHAQGLTPATHYIASTGIQGIPADTHAIIQLDTYAVTGHQPEQIRHLHALSHLNRTIEYGVTFERGTLIEYGDRSHAWISGTASINDRGEVMHLGDIVQQTQRMWDNVEALLAEAQMTMDDCAHIIVYLRDMADYATVRGLFAARFPDLPIVYTLAPVCRPAWLIEMECACIAAAEAAGFRRF